MNIVSDHFDAPSEQIWQVLRETEDLLSEAPTAVFDESELEDHRRRKPGAIFEERLGNLQISYYHSRNLILGLVTKLVLDNNPDLKPGSKKFIEDEFRKELLNKLSTPLGRW